jgi:hypothetical protein
VALSEGYDRHMARRPDAWCRPSVRGVTRYMDDREFQGSAFPILAKEIFETIRGARSQP